ncbi:hypothetical protein [Lysinibacillus pakistanensis]|uniref:hypothetical protein n=1 Tax=Lysinibacillus pakistanensis TaxID=759811 RepID=UPI003D298B61
MKTLINIMVTIASLFFVTGCVTEKKQIVEEITNHESELISEITNIDDLIELSDNIVVGNILYEEQFSDMGTYKYSFSVKNELKGDLDNQTIDVYEAKGVLEKGKEYVMFLEYWENELYPNPVYTSLGDNSIIEIDKNTLNGEEKIINQRTKDEIINYIKESPEAKKFLLKNNNIIEEANSTNDLVELSDNILRIIPKKVIHENKYVKTVEIEILQKLKGTIKQENTILNLPAEIELEKDYIVFLKGNEDYRLTTKRGSIISKDNVLQWQDTLNSFAK